jgi:hypothetical protein
MMFAPRLVPLLRPPLVLSRCSQRLTVSSRPPRFQIPVRKSTSLSPASLRKIIPSSFRRNGRKVRKTKPLPLSPSPISRTRRRIILYALTFTISGALTYAILDPNNIVNHFFHGCVRCSRVIISLAHCVYDYRMVIRRKGKDEYDQGDDMSKCHLNCAQRALAVFEQNGGIYIKLGQHLAALSYLIPIVLSFLFQVD